MEYWKTSNLLFIFTSEIDNIMIEEWRERAIRLLSKSLDTRQESNELDWKTQLSDNSERIAEHLSAFANHNDGGFLVFGVSEDGTLKELDKPEADGIIKKIGNISSNKLTPSFSVEHGIELFRDVNLLFIYIPEYQSKPVCVRGKDLYNCYERSAGQTRKMSSKTVQLHLANSNGISFEERDAIKVQSFSEIAKYIDIDSYYRVTDRNKPNSSDTIIEHLIASNCVRLDVRHYVITNLGAILFANNMQDFPHLEKKTVRLIHYASTNNREAIEDIRGTRGYAVGFDNLVENIINKLPYKEVIKDIKRVNIPAYPKVSIREFLANALVHQDFMVVGREIIVEIYKDRLTITNPGTPLNDVNRLIDMPPNSRNERLAQAMYELKMCERRGSGVDRAIHEIENMYLPPVNIEKGEDYTRVTMYSPKKLEDMTREETIRACYQHACMLHQDNETLTGERLCKRFNVGNDRLKEIEGIIKDTFDNKLLVLAHSVSIDNEPMAYVPYYA